MSSNDWKGKLITPQNAEQYVTYLKENAKGRHIVQGVSFNKNDDLQMEILKLALAKHGSFSGFVKYLLIEHFKEDLKGVKQREWH